MTTTGDQSWGTRQIHYDLAASKTAILPETLLRMSGVKHYCQSSLLGPLAIHRHPHKVAPPPEIITFHNPPHLASLEMNTYYPIVLGSVNRYMSIAPTMLYILGHGDIDPAGEILSAFEDVMKSLKHPVQVVCYEKNSIGPAEFEESMMAGTTLEFYNFIQLESRGTQTERTAKLQKVLDSVAGIWTGKVFIKTKEDCPPCSACGFRYE